MSENPKPRGTASGQAETELDKLKAVWRRMSDDARAYWLEQFSSQRTQAELRKEIQTKFKVNLARDNQLTRFRAFVERQMILDIQAERMEENRKRIATDHPDWTKDDVLAEVLKSAGEEALSSGDYKLGLKTISADAKRQALDFEREKFKEGLRSKIQAGLDAILAEAKNNPVIKAAVEQIQQATAKE